MKGRIWVTRPGPRGKTTRDRIREAGFDAFHISVLEMEWVEPEPPPRPPWPQWLVFTSANAVEAFFGALERRGTPPPKAGEAGVAAVGEATAARLAELGLPADLVPAVPRGEGLVDAFASISLREAEVWIPVGNQPGPARETLPRALTARGATVRLIEVYATRPRTLTPEDQELLSRGEPGAAILHSPSAARAVTGLARKDPPAARWMEAWAVAIGPTTAAAAEEAGFARVATCATPRDEAVIETLRDIGAVSAGRNPR